DLQFQIILIGPEPRHRIIALRASENRSGGDFRLIDCVLNALEAKPASITSARKTRAVPDGVDIRTVGAREFVDENAVTATDSGRGGEFIIGPRPRRDEHEI